jgi:hypothetical protein
MEAKWGKELTVLESRAQADSFRIMSVVRELAGEEIHLAAEVHLLQEMAEARKEHDHEARLFENGRLQDAHAKVDRLLKEKLKGKKKKKRNPSRIL